MGKKWFALPFLLLLQIPAGAATLVPLRDNVHDTVTYMLFIESRTYEDFTNEDEITFACFPGGGVSLTWHIGGRYSGDDMIDNVDYRFDRGPVATAKIADLESGSSLADFYNALLSHKRLSLASNGMNNDFDIVDLKKKIGPRSSFARQCAAALTGDARHQATTDSAR